MKGDAFAEHIAALIEASGKTDRQIAEDMGYTKPGIVAMFRAGTAKVPFSKVPALAAATGVDPAGLFRQALEVYSPDLLATIQLCMRGLVPKSEFVEQVTTTVGS